MIQINNELINEKDQMPTPHDQVQLVISESDSLRYEKENKYNYIDKEDISDTENNNNSTTNESKEDNEETEEDVEFNVLDEIKQIIHNFYPIIIENLKSKIEETPNPDNLTVNMIFYYFANELKFIYHEIANSYKYSLGTISCIFNYIDDYNNSEGELNDWVKRSFERFFGEDADYMKQNSQDQITNLLDEIYSLEFDEDTIYIFLMNTITKIIQHTYSGEEFKIDDSVCDNNSDKYWFSYYAEIDESDNLRSNLNSEFEMYGVCLNCIQND